MSEKEDFLLINGSIVPVTTRYTFATGGSYSIQGIDFHPESDTPMLEKVDISYATPGINRDGEVDIDYKEVSFLYGTPISFNEGINLIKENRITNFGNEYYNPRDIYAFVLTNKSVNDTQILYPIRNEDTVTIFQTREDMVNAAKKYFKSIQDFHRKINISKFISDVLDTRRNAEKRKRIKKEQ